MDRNGGFGRIREERKKLSFFKIFQSADLSSESMRALPYDFMQNLSDNDLSYKMVIRAEWGSSWEVDISKNPKFYYMEKSGWNQFVSDNALGENEFVTFTHTGLMRFDVNIYNPDGKEIVTPRKPPPTTPFSGVKKKEGESSYKDVKKEDETCESVEGVELEATKKKAEASKTSKKKKSKKVVSYVGVGEPSRGRKKKAEKLKTFKKKKIKKGVPEFKITIRKSYLKFLLLPRVFEVEHITSESKEYTIHHWKRKCSWNVLCLVRENRTVFSSGWCRLAREFPLKVGDRCTFKLIKPTEFVLITKKSRKEITVIG
ncbi:B3 domain-containing protein [Raphanus sativus]|uniref:B3 domain-containing protein At3g17010 n=1 Tax=Raphanus sativus TaxID=3726 RepID=A0A6J0NZE7_RAPSA|nr:B3 domain-containing protein At3g17010 [Raphanus sativus]KAJ4893816.1 B3 domain-containing protein [Raphanus sativus]